MNANPALRFLRLPTLAAWLCFGLHADVLVESDTTVGLGDPSLEGQRVIVSGATLTLAGPHTFSDLILSNHAVLTHVAAPLGQPAQALRLTVTGQAQIDATSRLDANGLGYAETNTPGYGGNGNYAGGGGGHGGRGHRSAGLPLDSGGAAFGSVLAPDSWGGAGGHGNSTAAVVPGGGVVQLEVGGELFLAGTLRADGATAWINNQGGGAGGTVYLKVGWLRGTGVISANGGGGEWVDGGGGAGGRIALLFGTNEFHGTLTAHGGNGAGQGGAGTLYLQPKGPTLGEVRIQNAASGEWTPLTTPSPFNLVIGPHAVVYPPQPLIVGTLTLQDGGTLVQAAGTTNLSVTATGDVVIAAGGVLTADGRGYPFGADRGPGSGRQTAWGGSGAGHGGWGADSATGALGGPHYGSVLQPVAMGSQGGNGDGGPGTAGGGAIRLDVAGRVTVHGRLSADGAGAPPNNAGGGSGGSLWISAHTLTGTGHIRAHGAAGEWVDGGGGAGGRIALYYVHNEFAGPLTATGASGAGVGGAGTIYTKGESEPQGELFIGNGGHAGNFTALPSPEAYRVVLGGRANVYPETALTLARLDLVGASQLTHLRGQTNLQLVVNGDVLIAADSTLHADGRGYPLGEDPGPGAGQQTAWGGSGGGHGGWGGSSATGAAGGWAYDSILEPVRLGSQGGPSDSGPGTAGGGAIRLIVGGQLAVLGQLSADGAGSPVNNAGGGAGGSVWITAQTLTGNGLIRAQGGPGEWVDGGGGGGGRIALYFATNTFTGTVAAPGGPARRGGAGTLYQRQLGSAFGQLLIHNGGEWGNYTPLTSPEPFHVILAENAAVFPESALTVQELEIRANSTLTHLPGQTRVDLQVLHNLTVAAGGRIDVNGRGYSGEDDRGPGGGSPAGPDGTGGGHGGVGATAAQGGAGGGSYDSLTAPTERGSAGGPGTGGPGGAGGGAIRVVVGNTLQVDGQITALGLNGLANNSGGGAGGSIHLTAAQLAGTGLILADGGAGEWVDGGGGGGGRIALQLGASTFSGSVFARGLGARPGGAGSIYTRTGLDPGGELVLDNGGNPGALSPLEVPPATRLVLGSGALVYPPTPLSVVSLRLKPGATLTHPSGQTSLAVQVERDFIIEAGATVSVDGRGYPFDGSGGPGAGNSSSAVGSGGGHGGTGGVSATGAPGGAVNGSARQPVAWGSQGGAGAGGPGGAGGGAVQLTVGGTLEIAGTLTANGLNGPVNNAGGGAGGSLWIKAGRLTGAGGLTAHGGAGEWVDGGGGSGGRIALYLGTNDFTGTLSTYGRGGHQTGAAGTIYTRLAPDSTGHLLVDNGGTWGAYTPLSTPEPFHLRIAQRAQVIPEEPLVVRSLTLESNTVLTHLTGQHGLQLVALGEAVINGAIEVSGRGYPWGENPGPGGGVQSSWAGSGAGHGGVGGRSATQIPGGPAYGSLLEPTTLGSRGGPGDGGPGGAGGGAVRLIAGGTLTVNGRVNADGERGVANNSGGGSGGSLFLSAVKFSGTGSLTANGGPGEWVDGGGGAGGRIAIYRSQSDFTGTFAVGGAGGSAMGEPGTLHEAEAPTVIWLSPAEGWVDGSLPLQVVALGASSNPAAMEFSHVRAGVVTPIATVPGTLTAATEWNTRSVPDDTYDLQVVVRDAAGRTLATSTRRVQVNNSVVWHRGALTGAERWSADQVHVVDGEFVLGPTGALTLEPGAVVKFVSGGRLTLQSGATLRAAGVPGSPVVLTSFLDDSVGGDSNLDAANSQPQPGSWRFALKAGATVEQNAHTHFRFHSQTFGGALTGDTLWTGDTLREITETVVVPAGATLTLEAGVILKFAAGVGLDLAGGSHLVVNGTLAQPVIFTSLRDDTYGGDTNDDGTRTRPAAGDWRSLRFQDGASGLIHHAEIRYGGNSTGNPWGAGGALEALGGPLTVRRSVIADALKDGAFCYGTTRFENCLVLRCDRGLTAVGEMTVLNCTLDGNRIGLLEHVGQLIVRNSIVANSLDVGIEHDLGGGVPVVTHCNLWNPDAPRGNYHGTPDRTGQAGNVSLAPRYRNHAGDNFRLNFVSPGIDAASGPVAPDTDFAGNARFDDPRTGNTGVPAANGAVPDMGAFEFADAAPSQLDLVVEAVVAPTQLIAGSLAHVEWTIVNRGHDAFAGPWHDALALRLAGSNAQLPVAELLVGHNVTLGPGQSFRMSADVRVPGGINGSYQWVVTGNSRGELFEAANATNNEATTRVPATLQVPALTLAGGPLGGQFNAQEEHHWFVVTAPPGQDVRLQLDLLAANGSTELYAGRGFMPTPDNFTSRQREWSAADTSVVISGAGAPTGPGNQNVFYVLAVGRVLTTQPERYTLQASTADFTVERVSPAAVGNAGLVTLEINGAKFSAGTRFALRAGTERRLAIRQSVRGSGRAFATFDLTGLPPGQADVAAERDGLTVSLTAAVDIQPGGAPDFYVNLSGPTTTRAGRTTTWFVTYGNRGSVDQPLPLLRFRAPGASEIRLFDHTLNWADSFVFLGLNAEHFLPTLGPGQEVTLPVRLKTTAATTVNLDALPGEAFTSSPLPFNWSALPAPAGVAAAPWTALLATLPARLGATAGDYAAKLQADLEQLAASELRHAYVANVNGQWLFGDEPAGVATPNPSILVPDDVLNEPTAAQRHAGPAAKLPGDGLRKTYFVVISIEDYSGMWGHTHTNDLPGTRQDSADLQQYLEQDLRVPPEQQYVGHDSPTDNAAWTRDHILNTIRSFKGKVDADDNLVVVFSGHGGWNPRSGIGYFCANGGYVSPAAFAHAVDEVGAGTTYLINDSCHSEAFNENVHPVNTTWVGLAGTQADRISWDTASGGELITHLKGQLRKCHGLGEAFERTRKIVTDKYATQTNVVEQQAPVLTNPSAEALTGKPWNDPSGFWQELEQGLNRLPYHPWSQTLLSLVGSVDPNDKYALAGVGPEHWVQVGQALPFEIVFENKTNAAAPAQEVLVFDQLDPQLDWSTFELKSLAFNDARLTVPPGLQRFTTTTTVGTDPNAVDVDVSFNPATGRITWLLRSRDAATGELPEDPFAGFLPPNDASHRGEGSLSYVVRPRADLADGTRLTNRATILFDPTYGANPPILTPQVTNALDASRPTSQVQALPLEINGPLVVQWFGADAAGSSGIASFDVYVARAGEPFQVWQLATTEPSATFTGEPGWTYHFYSVARDFAGNTETTPATPDAVTTVAGGYTYATWAAGQNLPAQARGPDDDADQDGLSNFGEYAYALNPLVADRTLSVPQAALIRVAGQDYLTLTYRQPPNSPSDLRYRTTWSGELSPWAGQTDTVTLGPPVDRGTHLEITVRAPVGSLRRESGFLRLELLR